MLTLALILLIIAFASGAPLWSIMILGAALGSIATGRGLHDDFGGSISEFIRMGTGDAADVFSTIPLFIFAGYIMAASKTARSLPARSSRRSPAPRASPSSPSAACSCRR